MTVKRAIGIVDVLALPITIERLVERRNPERAVA